MKKCIHILMLFLLICSVIGTVSAQTGDAGVIYSISHEECRPGSIVELELTVSSTAAHDSAALYNLKYDKTALTFVGFEDYSDIEKECQFQGGFDNENTAISLPFKKSEVRNGFICRLRFEINEQAKDGVYSVSMASIVKNKSVDITSTVIPGSITVISSDHKHDIRFSPADKGTCTEAGTVEHWYCSTCLKCYSDSSGTNELTSVETGKNPAVHSGGTEIRNYQAPTATQKGYTGDTYCLGCKSLVSSGIEIPSLGSDAADVVFTMSASEADPGGTAEVTVSVNSSAEFNSLALFNLIYDKNVFTFDGFADYEAADEKCMIPGGFDNEKEAITLMLKKTESFNGYICKIRFKVASDASKGEYTIGLNSLVRIGQTEISSEVRTTEISVTDRVVQIVRGDINKDGAVDTRDADILARYFAGWAGYEEKILDKAAADMNGDGALTRKDGMILARKAANWTQNID